MKKRLKKKLFKNGALYKKLANIILKPSPFFLKLKDDPLALGCGGNEIIGVLIYDGYKDDL